ncbi:hypothetical protein D3C75_1192540 [compost metagenome]
MAVVQLEFIGHEWKQEGQRQTVEKHKPERQEQHAEQRIFITGFIIVVSHGGSP